MAISQLRSKLKISGGRYIDARKKRLNDLGREPTLAKVGEKRNRKIRIKGGKEKIVTLSDNIINVYDAKAKKYVKAKIKTIIENSANRHFVRRNIITKGAILDTDLGKVRITSRPGQENMLNGVLV